MEQERIRRGGETHTRVWDGSQPETTRVFFGVSAALLQQGNGTLERDRIFARYAFGLIGGIAFVVTCVVSAGIADLPTLDFLVEHAGLAVLFRASYKSFNGSNWIKDALERSGMITAPTSVPPMGAAGAMS